MTPEPAPCCGNTPKTVCTCATVSMFTTAGRTRSTTLMIVASSETSGVGPVGAGVVAGGEDGGGVAVADGPVADGPGAPRSASPGKDCGSTVLPSKMAPATTKD